jgi:hypothetical protein
MLATSIVQRMKKPDLVEKVLELQIEVDELKKSVHGYRAAAGRSRAEMKYAKRRWHHWRERYWELTKQDTKSIRDL